MEAAENTSTQLYRSKVKGQWYKAGMRKNFELVESDLLLAIAKRSKNSYPEFGSICEIDP